jgi:hypothetical protein
MAVVEIGLSSKILMSHGIEKSTLPAIQKKEDNNNRKA